MFYDKNINNKIFCYLKLLTLLFAKTTYSNNLSCENIVTINISEACFLSLINRNININMLEGVFLIITLNYLKKTKFKISNFKIWCLIYLHWNIEFCKSINHPFIISLGHNLPPLIIFAMNLKKYEKYLNYWTSMRGICLMRTGLELIFIDKLVFKKKSLDYKISLLTSLLIYYIKDNQIKQGVWLTNLINTIPFTF